MLLAGGMLWAMACGLMGCVGAGVVWYVGKRRAAQAPYVPTCEGAVVGANAATRFHAAVHDLVISVFEGWNAAQARGCSVEEALDRETLRRRARRVSETCDELAEAVGSAGDVARALRAFGSPLEGAWTSELLLLKTPSGIQTERLTMSAVVARDALEDWPAPPPAAAPRLRGATLDLARLDADERLVLQAVARSTTGQDLGSAAGWWLRGSAWDAALDALEAARASLVEQHRDALVLMMGAPESSVTVVANVFHAAGPPQEWLAWVRLREHLRDANAAWERVEACLTSARSIAERLGDMAGDASTVEDDVAWLQLAQQLQDTCFPDSPLSARQPVDPWVAATIGALIAAVGLVPGLVALGMAWQVRW